VAHVAVVPVGPSVVFALLPEVVEGNDVRIERLAERDALRDVARGVANPRRVLLCHAESGRVAAIEQALDAQGVGLDSALLVMHREQEHLVLATPSVREFAGGTTRLAVASRRS